MKFPKLTHLSWCAASLIATPFLLLGAGSGTVALAADGQPYNCFGPAPYNCYSNGDIDPQAQLGTYDQLYQAYAEFAWQDFVALNFPAKFVNGLPVPEPSTVNGLDYNNGEYVTVWQTYTSARDMFQSDGSAPPAFGSGHQLPQACDPLSGGTIPVSPGAPVLDEYIEANRMGPVVDQDGWFLRYGINFNEAMYDYIVNNQLYNQEGQEAFDTDNPNRSGSPVNWPRGAYKTVVKSNKIKSIFIKSSWKILGPGTDETKFFRTPAWIYNPAGGIFGDEPTVQESCVLRWVGLVGFHIVHRTKSAPQWVWSTFEHVDNAPWMADFADGTPTGDFTLFDPDTCPAQNGKPSCEYNQVPGHPWNPDSSRANPPQIVRIAAPGKQAIAANQSIRSQMQAAFGPTVWDNYFLVDVQFPTKLIPTGKPNGKNDINPAYPDGLPTPSHLANSTMETYIQGFTDGDVTSNGNDVPWSDQMQNVISIPGGVVIPAPGGLDVDPWNPNGLHNISGGAQRNSSSCIACHGDSAMVTGTFANYVFSLNRAKSASGQPPSN